MEAADADTSAGSADQPVRRETFLARYSRNFKMAATVAVLAALVLPWAAGRVFLPPPPPSAATPRHATPIQAVDNQAERAVKLTETANVTETGGDAALNQPDDRTIKLVSAPDPALTEDTPQGSLPRIGEDGRQPWQVYARPFNAADKRPRVAIVMTDLGLSRTISDEAIARLPANVTLVFNAESPVVGAWCTRARQDGHEVLLGVPMEPFDYPRSDPGPNTLLVSLPNSDNIGRLLWSLRQSTGYIGITTLSGSRFTTDPQKMKPVLEVLKDRGLMVFDAGIAPHGVIMDLAKYDHIPAAAATQRLDGDLSPDIIDESLNQLEKSARVNGSAVGIAAPTPLMIDRLQLWAKGLTARGIALAPVSAIAH